MQPRLLVLMAVLAFFVMFLCWVMADGPGQGSKHVLSTHHGASQETVPLRVLCGRF